MENQLIFGLLLTVLPVFELRAGLPVIIEYLLRNNLPIIPYFLLVLFLNILVIFFIFFFLDFVHIWLMRFKFYRRKAEKVLVRFQKKAKKVEKKMEGLGYFALMFFVAIPLPGTGAWTGCLVSWLLGLDRRKSFAAIALGIILAGFFVLFASLGFFARFY